MKKFLLLMAFMGSISTYANCERDYGQKLLIDGGDDLFLAQMLIVSSTNHTSMEIASVVDLLQDKYSSISEVFTAELVAKTIRQANREDIFCENKFFTINDIVDYVGSQIFLDNNPHGCGCEH